MNTKVYVAQGTVRYKGGWIVLETPLDMVIYYKWWVEKYLGKKISTSYHKPHVTVLAGKHERGLEKHPLWRKHDGEKLWFEYDSYIHTDDDWFTQGEYFWLRVRCSALETIRTELGLKPTPFHPYHLTIGFCGY